MSLTPRRDCFFPSSSACVSQHCADLSLPVSPPCALQDGCACKWHSVRRLFVLTVWSKVAVHVNSMQLDNCVNSRQ